jgi:hypothetical protein
MILPHFGLETLMAIASTSKNAISLRSARANASNSKRSLSWWRAPTASKRLGQFGRAKQAAARVLSPPLWDECRRSQQA